MLGEPLPTFDDLGPPVLLKRLGNALEGELARGRLLDAGIPATLSAADAFSADGRPIARQVELFVPRSLVHDALDVLDIPPLEAEAFDDEAYPVDDPGRPIAFRGFVASVVGWLIVFLAVVGAVLAVPMFGYAASLAVAAVRRSTLRDRGLRFQVAATLALSVAGAAMSVVLLLDVFGAI